MCSNDIEDIDKLIGNTEKIDPEKLKQFMVTFVDKSTNKENFKDIEKAYIETKIIHRVNPSKRQMRDCFYSENMDNNKLTQVFKRYLVKKAMRSQSGVLVVTITLSPHQFSCKYDCYYCPQETDLEGNHTQPRSYMSSEPAMRRALRYNFDVRGQFWDRINCYKSTGNIDNNDTSSKKMEVILSGGTWECYPIEEREKFINRNDYLLKKVFNKEKTIESLLKLVTGKI